MVSEERLRVIETNRSLRLIKNELESLLAKDIISDSVFDSIMGQLPQESNTPRASHADGTATPSLPIRSSNQSTTTTMLNTPAPAYARLGVSTPTPDGGIAPTGLESGVSTITLDETPTGPGSTPSPLPNQAKPPVAFARALYRYDTPDSRDVHFVRDDRIAVLEYMNADWWLGRNTRTGQEGIFPRNYVEVVEENLPIPGRATDSNKPSNATTFNFNGWNGNEKVGMYQSSPLPQYEQAPISTYPPPPAQSNPYSANVPPMAVAEQQQQQQQPGTGHNKIAEQGKKFGRKLGNAAIFGAGATLGSDLVNSIF